MARDYELTSAIETKDYLIKELKIYMQSLIDNSYSFKRFTLISPSMILDKKFSELWEYFIDNGDKLDHWYSQRFYYEYGTRCGYEMKALDIKPIISKGWIIRTDVDLIVLKDLQEKIKKLSPKYDIYLLPENRRFLGNRDFTIMKNLSKMANVKPFDWTVKSMEDKEEMYPIFQCGVQIIKAKLFEEIDLFKEWNYLNNLVEKFYGDFHSLELAWSLLCQKYDLKIGILSEYLNWNPITYWRDGDFPSQKLKNDAFLPENVVILHYHKPYWLKYFKDDKRIKSVLDKLDIEESWFDSSPY